MIEFGTQVRDMIKALIRSGSEFRMQVSDFINSGSDFFGLCETSEPFLGKNHWQGI